MLKNLYVSIGEISDISRLLEMKTVSEYQRLVFDVLKHSLSVEVPTSQDEVIASLGRDYSPPAYKMVSYPDPKALDSFIQGVNEYKKYCNKERGKEIYGEIVSLCQKIIALNQQINAMSFKTRIIHFMRLQHLKQERKKLLDSQFSYYDWLDVGYALFGEKALIIN